MADGHRLRSEDVETLAPRFREFARSLSPIEQGLLTLLLLRAESAEPATLAALVAAGDEAADREQGPFTTPLAAQLARSVGLGDGDEAVGFGHAPERTLMPDPDPDPPLTPHPGGPVPLPYPNWW